MKTQKNFAPQGKTLKMLSDRYCETLADMAYLSGTWSYYSGDSRKDMQTFRAWAHQFEAQRKVDADGNETYYGKDYLTAIEEFVMKHTGNAANGNFALQGKEEQQARDESELEQADCAPTTMPTEPAGKHILVHGNPIAGFAAIGPFVTHALACEHGDYYLPPDWWVMPIDDREVVCARKSREIALAEANHRCDMHFALEEMIKYLRKYAKPSTGLNVRIERAETLLAKDQV